METRADDAVEDNAVEKDRSEFPESPGDVFSTLKDIFKKPENLTIPAAILLVLGIVWVSIELSEKLEKLRNLMTQFLANGFAPALGKENEVKVWLAGLLLILGAMPLVLAILWVAAVLVVKSLRRNLASVSRMKTRLEAQQAKIMAERNRLSGAFTQLEKDHESLRKMFDLERERVATTLQSRNDNLARTLNGTIRAASKIRNQLFPVANKPGKTIEAVHYLYYISKELDTEVHRRYVIRAGETPLHFWQSSIEPSSDASPVETFADIRYQVLSHDVGKDVVYLPTKNELYSKSACIYFLPQIEPGQARDIEIAYVWPGMATKLAKQGWEDFAVKLNNAATLKSYQLEIYLEPGSGGTIRCSESGVPLPNKSLEQVQSHHGWMGWRYQATDVPPALLSNEIILRVDWRHS